MRRVIVIGGGASGLMAAVSAAGQGAKVTLLEKNRQVGKKLLATGNGRCNFSNRNQDLKHYRSDDPEFAERALAAFSVEDTLDFFGKLGIIAKDRNGWLYPLSGQAASVAGALRMEAERLRVKLACNTEALSIEPGGKSPFLVRTEGWEYEADAVVLACGSKAAPQTGSAGDGYRFAQSLGHSLKEPLPALTGLCAREKDCGKLSGVRYEAKAALEISDETKQSEYGEVQFAEYGLSGIPIFQLSRYAARALKEGKPCAVSLDFLPDRGKAELADDFRERAGSESIGERPGAAALMGLFPEKLAKALIGRAGIPSEKKAKNWDEMEIRNLIFQMKGMRFIITGVRGFDKAQVCAGGVPLSELKGISMESEKCPGLFLAGELLDVDGACGGYNLQWAWTSGFLAGKAAASENGRCCG